MIVLKKNGDYMGLKSITISIECYKLGGSNGLY